MVVVNPIITASNFSSAEISGFYNVSIVAFNEEIIVVIDIIASAVPIT
jgi:hypothetical protein